MDRKIVSIWTANTGWESSVLRDVISSEYSENGDFLGSEFSKAFSLDLVDDDAIEADKTEQTYSLIEAIEGYSYDINIVFDMKNKNTTLTEEPIDTIIAIYDYFFQAHRKAALLETNYLYIAEALSTRNNNSQPLLPL